MSKIGRNDPCHCGSGKKYKKCCQGSDQAQRSETPSLVQPGTGRFIEIQDDVDLASNNVVKLLRQGRLDEAEQAGFALLRDFPDVHDGYERLGLVFETKGDKLRAAEMYQQALNFAADKDGYDDELLDRWRDKVSQLRASTPT